jgi:hypothetical protein
MRLSELYKHKAAYDEMMAVLTKYKQLPCVDNAMYKIRYVAQACQDYEKWRIDKPYWDYSLCLNGISIYTCPVAEISNQINKHGMHETLKFTEPKDLLQIWFSTGAYIFGQDYPKELFNEFYCALKTECPPLYEDGLNAHIYYKPKDAAKAYETCMRLYDEYSQKYKEQVKERRVKALEEELAKLKGGAK